MKKIERHLLSNNYAAGKIMTLKEKGGRTMSEILVNQAGVKTQAEAVAVSSQNTGQAAAEYVSQSNAHQSELDGAARFDARQLNNYALQAIAVACETTHNMCSFMTNAAQAMSSTDQAQSRRFNLETGRE